MPKNKQKKSKGNTSYDIYSEAFPPNKDGKRSKIITYSETHDLLKEQGDGKINELNP